jgi:glucose-6-phosphate isomerase
LLDTIKGVGLHGLFLYGEAFDQIAAWFEQLWAESLGKNGKGPRPMGMIGTRAQHGVHQDNLEGKPNKVILFVGVQEARIEEKNISEESVFGMGDWKFSQVLYAGMNTAIEDLKKRGRPSMTWMIPKINEESLAEFLYTLEMATHVAGRLNGENPYDQPAVEEAKIGARKALSDAQKLPSDERVPQPISDFLLKTDQALSHIIGNEHGVTPEEIVSVHKTLEKVHSDIGKVLGGEKSLTGSIQWLNQISRVDFDQIQSVAKKLMQGHEIICIAGIGGSISGAKAVIQSLSYLNGLSKTTEIFYLENSDAESLALLDARVKGRCEGRLDYSKVAVNVISQSGETAETLAMFEALLGRYKKSNVTDEMLKQKIVVTTNERQGTLLAWGKKMGCPVLFVPSDIMGVLCVFGNMGFFPLALAGRNIQRFSAGIRKAQERALKPCNDSQNHAFRLAELFYLLDTKKGKDKHGFFMYSDALKSVADWVEQLWAEAFGKSEKVGPRPLNMIGTTAQHSVNQDNIAGKNDKAILFIGVQKPRIDFKMPGESVDYLAENYMSQLLLASLEGTRQALTARQRPNMLWMIPEINEERIGELMYTLALTAMIAGDLYGVNPYIQPALEQAKKSLKSCFVLD